MSDLYLIFLWYLIGFYVFNDVFVSNCLQNHKLLADWKSWNVYKIYAVFYRMYANLRSLFYSDYCEQ